MSLLAALIGTVADASLAGVQHSSFAYADPKTVQKHRAEKAAACTPCAAGARLERAQQHVARIVAGPGPVSPSRPRTRRVAGT